MTAMSRLTANDHIPLSPAPWNNWTPEDALARIIARADILWHYPDGGTFLLIDIPGSLLAYLESFGAADEDMEDGDEDCCPDFEDQPHTCPRFSCWGPGDPDDAEGNPDVETEDYAETWEHAL